jgi:hypothetical protein
MKKKKKEGSYDDNNRLYQHMYSENAIWVFIDDLIIFSLSSFLLFFDFVSDDED